MTDDEEQQAAAWAAEVVTTHEAWRAAVRGRNAYYRLLYGTRTDDGSYRADVVDLHRASGIGRGMIHTIVRGARDETEAAEAIDAAEAGAAAEVRGAAG